MNIIFFGPPGSGKGTHASRLAPKLKVPHIVTGEMFREEIKKGTELGKLADSYMSRGQLVPDEVVIGVVKARLNQPDTKNGFILDGFPRTIEQAKALDGITKIDKVVNLIVPDEVIIERLSLRRQCRTCGAIYHLKWIKPKKEGICDKDGGPLYQRDDDKLEVVKARLDVYKKQTKPLLPYYKKKGVLVDVRGAESPEVTFNSVVKALGLKGISYEQ